MLGCLLAWCAGVVVGDALLLPDLVTLAATAAAAFGAIGAGVMPFVGTRCRQLVLIPAVFALALARGAVAVDVPSPSSITGHLGETVAMVGRVTRAAGSGTVQAVWLTDLHLRGERVAGTVMASARSPVTVVPGSTLRVTGGLERLPGRAHDGSTGYDERMQRLGVMASIPGATFTLLRPPEMLSAEAAAWRVRASLSTGVRSQVPEPEASILLGELVGIRGRLPPPTERDLVNSGLVHLLAVSGLKVALVASALTLLLRQAGRRACLLAIVGILMYALVGGGSAAALRSALMGSLGLAARVLRRDADPPRSLLVAATCMLGLNPALGADLSFQYSFIGVAGIYVMQPGISARLHALPSLVREGLAVSVAAQVATLPITAAYFHVISPLSPLLNLVALPLLGPTMLVTTLVALAGAGPAGVLAQLASGSARLVLLLAHAGAAPGVALAVPWFAPRHAVAYLGGLTVLLVMPAGWRYFHVSSPGLAKMARASALPLAALTACSTLLVLWRPDGRLHLVLLDTPGAGALVTAPDGARLLVDTGTDAASLRAALDGTLDPLHPVIDAVLVTASGRKEAGGLAGLGARRPAVYMWPPGSAGEAAWRFADELSRAGTTTVGLAAGEVVSWHGLLLSADGCGSGLAVTLRMGAVAAWLCSSGSADDPGSLPRGALAVVDLGPGLVRPDGPLEVPGWVVTHSARGGARALPPRELGPRLWRTPRDGPLYLSCDAGSCRREPSQP
ncbi:MAG: ComEC/Rec2 family competence protein [Candidatus Dormibacteria bacterium]